jgi:4-amino-4-deoxy-L-arabinose transferase-like glycosyltransferase
MPEDASLKPAGPAVVAVDLSRLDYQVLLTLTLAFGVYFLSLGSSGFAFSEGVRVFPGWEMARHGDWWMPHLFEQAYLRKPPGMSWAVAGMSLILGESEFSARAVSATSMTMSALLSLWFARRWFGPQWGMLAGPAFLLTPLYWYPGRSAEIEALHNLFVLGASLTGVEVMLRRGSWWWAGLLGLCIGGMAVAKGPAGVPCVAGAMAGACVAARSWGALRSPRLAAGLSLGACLTGLVVWRLALRAAELPEPPVLQGADHFLWRREKIGEVLTLPFVAAASALPWGFALVFALPALAEDREQDRLGRAAAWAVVAALLIYSLAGVSNNRYAMPGTVLLPVIAAYAGWRLARGGPRWMHALAHWTGAHRPWLWLAGLFIAASISRGLTDHRRDTVTSGKRAGIALAEALPDRAVVWGDAMIDNRPEVAWYAQHHGAGLGKDLRLVWTPAGKHGRGPFPVPPAGEFLVLLEEGQTELPESELARYRRAGVLDGLRHVHTGRAHKFLFQVFQVPTRERLVDGRPESPVFPRGRGLHGD